MNTNEKYEKIFDKKVILDKGSVIVSMYETPKGEILSIEYKGKIELFAKR